MPTGPGALTVEARFRGRPLAGVLVVALSTADAEVAREARTGADGNATIELGAPGLWLVKAVHMEPAPPGLDADWESWWSSLTLALPSE